MIVVGCWDYAALHPGYSSGMRSYLRNRTAGGLYFFTVNLAERHGNALLVDRIDLLREAFRMTFRTHPVVMEAVVVLPDHLHCIWRLPQGEHDYATRWRLIKAKFSHGLGPGERRSASRIRKGERGIWQRRYWEHLIRDDDDYARHADYIHYNPVKHGYVSSARDWPYSSFARWVARGIYPEDWGRSGRVDDLDLE